jgi:hypothetical protein
MKAIGLFGITPDNRPPWASFGQIAEWDDFDAAAQYARASGCRWVLWVHHGGPGPMLEHARAVRERADRAGLSPFVLAWCYREEWYEHYRHGLLADAPIVSGLNPRDAADEVAGVERIRGHLGEAHAAMRAAWPGLAVAWVAALVNNSHAYGSQYYAPVPDGVDVIALDPYATAGQTFDAWPGVVIAHAVATTTHPIAIVPQWFAQPGTSLAAPPDATAQYFGWLRHPRVIALWGFTWASRREAGIVGLQDMPTLRASVESWIRREGGTV